MGGAKSPDHPVAADCLLNCCCDDQPLRSCRCHSRESHRHFGEPKRQLQFTGYQFNTRVHIGPMWTSPGPMWTEFWSDGDRVPAQCEPNLRQIWTESEPDVDRTDVKQRSDSMWTKVAWARGIRRAGLHECRVPSSVDYKIPIHKSINNEIHARRNIESAIASDGRGSAAATSPMRTHACMYMLACMRMARASTSTDSHEA